MRLEAYIFLIFSISLVFYLIGYRPIAMTFMFNQENGQFLDPATILASMISAMVSPTNPLGAINLIVLAAAIIAAALGFAAMYILPALMLIEMLNFFVFPLSFLVQQSDPSTALFYVPFVVLLNILTVMAYANFIRGGS